MLYKQVKLDNMQKMLCGKGKRLRESSDDIEDGSGRFHPELVS